MHTLSALFAHAPQRIANAQTRQDADVRQALEAIKAANTRSSLGEDWGGADAAAWPYLKLDAAGRLVEL